MFSEPFKVLNLAEKFGNSLPSATNLILIRKNLFTEHWVTVLNYSVTNFQLVIRLSTDLVSDVHYKICNKRLLIISV